MQEKNAEKTELIAKGLYPHEKWELLENGIFIAKSRMPRSAEQINVLDKELEQARILVSRGSTVFLLPESDQPKIKKKKYPDAVVDGYVTEFKTITGGIRQVERRYKKAKEKNPACIFMLIDADLKPDNVKWKLSGYIKRKGLADNSIILAYFTKSDEFHEWSEDELVAGGNTAAKSR